jgi:hypothetical protein
MVPTCVIDGWIVAMMRGPRRNADDFPCGQGRLQHDD